jgi:hypothetical protein
MQQLAIWSRSDATCTPDLPTIRCEAGVIAKAIVPQIEQGAEWTAFGQISGLPVTRPEQRSRRENLATSQPYQYLFQAVLSVLVWKKRLCTEIHPQLL